MNHWDTHTPSIIVGFDQNHADLVQIHNLQSKAIAFNLTHFQAPTKSNTCSVAPTGIKMNFQGRSCILKLKQNIYRLKDGERTWRQHYSKVLADKGCSLTLLINSLRDDIIIICCAEKHVAFVKKKYDKETRRQLEDRKFI